MEFSPREFAEPAVDLRYSPNKMHGDEIEAAGDGLTLRERDPGGWLERGEIEALIRATPAIELLLIDDTARGAAVRAGAEGPVRRMAPGDCAHTILR